MSARGRVHVSVLGLVPPGALRGGVKVVMWRFASWQGSGAGGEVWVFGSTEEPDLDGFATALRVLQKILLFSTFVDVSLFILNCS